MGVEPEHLRSAMGAAAGGTRLGEAYVAWSNPGVLSDEAAGQQPCGHVVVARVREVRQDIG